MGFFIIGLLIGVTLWRMEVLRMKVEEFKRQALEKIGELKTQAADNQTQVLEVIGHEHEEVMTTFEELKQQIGDMDIPEEVSSQVLGAIEDAKTDLSEKSVVTKEAVQGIFDDEG